MLVAGITFLSSLRAISTNFSEGTSTYSCAPLITKDKRPLYEVSLNIFSLLNTHCMGELSSAANVCSIRDLLNKRCIEIIGDGCSSGTEFNSVPFVHSIPGLSPSPIISIHLLFNKSLTEYSFAALLNSPIQWVFNKEKIFRDAAYRGLLSIVISGAHQYIDVSSEELVEMALRELKKVIPATSTAKLLRSKVIKERHATFSPQPGIDKHRPSQTTAIRNLFIAGDWTDTGLPATIEGAVLSGQKCAKAIENI